MRGKFVSFIYAILCLATVVISCVNQESGNMLSEAERLMQERPDSALLILESISSNSIQTGKDQALYGLLLTQARDKNFLSPQNDSLITLSVNYYNSRGDALKQAISNYYQGRVRYNSGNMQSALVSYIKAKDMAEDNGYYFWAGMACRGISDIYNGTYNKAEELNFAKKEYDFIKKSEKQPYLNYSIHDLGRALRNNGKYDESLILAKQLADSAIKYQDAYLYHGAQQLKAFNLTDMCRYNEASDLFSELCTGDFAENIDSLYLCHNLFEIGRVGDAEMLLDIISDENMPMKHQLRYKIAKISHKYSEALAEAELIDSLCNADFRGSVSHNLTSSLAEYYALNKELDESKIHSSRVTTWIITMSLILVILLMSVLGWQIYNYQNRKISEKVLLANQLQEDLENSKHANSSATSVIKSLMSTKYELLEELSLIVLRNNDTKVARKKIADAVTRLIEDFSIHSEKIVLLEKKVDSLYDNLMSEFKKDLPNLKEVDYRLFLFSVLGLSNATISLFLKEDKIDAVYNRKRRLKDKLKQLGSPKSERYLAHFA